jgi:hypothetical protein
MGTVLQLDILHLDPDGKQVDEKDSELKESNMAVMARILLEPETSCEHEILVAHEIMTRLDSVQREAIKAAMDAINSSSSEEPDQGEIVH